MKTLHLFFNGDGVTFPPRNADWNGYGALQDVRMFNVCAESWTRQGWNVKRLTTAPGNYLPFTFTGRCAPTNPCASWYPAAYWQFLAKAITVADSAGYTAFATIDMLNHGLTPEMARLAIHRAGDPEYVSFQTEHLSFAGFAAKRTWLDSACRTLLGYDAGELPDLGRAVCDEYILRAFTKAPVCLPFATMANNTDARRYPLTHHGRSTLRFQFESVPLS